jgi:hypothetical protein
MDRHWQARLGSVIAAAGLIWTAQAATRNFSTLNALFPLPVGPLEICGIGIVIWLHAKWRSSIAPR